VGLYINLPKNAFVICLGEKTSLQAISPFHEKLPLKLGHVERRGSRYRRHDALVLYVALKVHEGEVLERTEKQFMHAFLSFIKIVYGKGWRKRDLLCHRHLFCA